MHSQGNRRLSPEDLAYAIERGKRLVAMSRDPNSKLLLATQIFEDAFSNEVPKEGAVLNRHGSGMAGHARRDTVPDLPPPPQPCADEDRRKLEALDYNEALTRRAGMISSNERKLRALLWARAAFLELRKPEAAERSPTPSELEAEFHAETLESAVREWFLCSLPHLPTDGPGIEMLTRANARASWSLLQRVRREREAQLAAALSG